MTEPLFSQPQRLGALVGSSSHVMVHARIFDDSMVAAPPAPADYAFGAFVGLALAPTTGAPQAVGIIANSRLINPDEGYAGPRLTVPQSDNAVFAPDFLNELGVEISVLLLGTLTATHGDQAVVREVLPVGTEVYALPAASCHRFHHAADGAFQMRYTPLLQEASPGLSQALMALICQQLAALCDDEERQMMEVLRRHVAWQTTFQAMS